MKRFRNILVVAPPGVDIAATLMAAEKLALGNGAQLTLFDVVPPVNVRDRNPGGHSEEEIRRLVEQARTAQIEEVAGTISSVPVEIAVATGTLFLEVIRRTMAFEHDLVIISPDQDAGAVGLTRASTVMHLMRKCPVPVWVLRSEASGRGDVMAAVGPFDDGAPTLLDRKIVELGSSLAALHGGRFHLVHSWSLQGESLLRNGRVRLAAAEVDRFVEEAEVVARGALDKLLADTGIPQEEVELHLVKGDAADSIIRLAAELSPDVVVMGTLARSGIAGLLIGNSAENVLGSLQASILAVKPVGFRTPVSL